MNILAIDTSSSSMSVCIKSDSYIKGEINLNNGLVHSTTLMPCIEILFKTINFDKKALDLIAVCIGPGSFTGIRIGVATANAISLALDVPVISIGTLDALAMNFLYFNGLIISTIDAQRDNFYVGIYKSNHNNIIPVCENSIMSDEELEEYIKNSNEQILLAGDATQIITNDKIILANSTNNFIKSSNIAILGEQLYSIKKEYNFANPVYMRKSQAEIIYDEKQKNN